MLSQVMFICTVFIGTLAQLIWNNSGDQLKAGSIKTVGTINAKNLKKKNSLKFH